jgi:virulence activator alpha
VLGAERLEHLRRLDRLHAMHAALGEHAAGLPSLTLRRGIAYHEMMVAWIDDVRAVLEAR